MLEKILVTGFPHTGTTILRKIIGRSEEVIDEEKELMNVNPSNYQTQHENASKAIVHKWPFATDLNLNPNSDKKIIFIIRNPYYVFSSLNNRMGYELRKKHTIDDYEKTSELFLSKTNNTNLLRVKYEDLFQNNFQELRNIFHFLNLEYSPTVTDFQDSPEDMPPEEDHVRFRNWQTRQKFRCMNDPSRLNLMPEQVEKISQIKTISDLGYSMG